MNLTLHVLRLAILFCIFPRSAAAQTLPLDGYYRPGAYMPVKIPAGNGQLRIEAADAIPTYVAASTTDQLAPILILSDQVTELKVGSTTLALKPLKANQRIVSTIGADAHLAQSLFPDREIINIKLSITDLQTANPVNFDAIDALILSPEVFQTISANAIDVLLGCNVIIAVNSAAPPDKRHDWEVINGYQVAKSTLRWVSGALPREDVYQPIAGWRPQRSASARWLIVLISAAVVVGFLALYQLPRQAAMVVIVIFATGVLIAAIGISRTPLARTWIAEGKVTEQSHVDAWRYYAAVGDMDFEVSLADAAYPIPYSLQHAKDIGLTLHASSNDLRCTFKLRDNVRLCVLGQTDVEAGTEGIDVSELRRLYSP